MQALRGPLGEERLVRGGGAGNDFDERPHCAVERVVAGGRSQLRVAARQALALAALGSRALESLE
jgi:hypothetical protein